MDPVERTDIRSGDRVIEVAPTNLDLADWCLANGASYLGLVPPEQLAAMTHSTEPARRAELLAPLNSIDEISANNADVLVLNPPYHRLVWQRRIGNVDIVATPARGSVGIECTLAAALVRRRRTRRPAWGGRRYRAVAQVPYRYASARHYLSPTLGVTGLPDRLDEHSVNYAVLRWFDTLPHVEPGEDLDILVADHDLERLLGVLESAPGTIACDIYSETGLPEADYQGMAYYPPRLAAELLASTERHQSGYRVPGQRAYFRSLAYHAVYHKGERSGLPSATAEVRTSVQPEHDYAEELAGLAVHDGYSGAITMEDLDDHLANVGWRPSRDNLARLAEHNGWLRARHFLKRPGGSTTETDDGATVVFILREQAGEHGVTTAERVISEHGLEVLAIHTLDAGAREWCAREMRGGNWGPGPYPASGGDPAVAIVALDRLPRQPTPSQLERYPALSNANIVTIKVAVRDAILAELADTEHYNPIHSSDCELDAWEYVEMTMPAQVSHIRELVAARRDQVAPLLPHDPTVDAADDGDGNRDSKSAHGRLAARSIALWLPRRARAFLGHRIGRWRLAGITDDTAAR